MNNRKDLYAQGSKGKILQWSIWSEDDHIHIEYGQIDGEKVETTERVVFGLAGRSREEQIAMRIQSRVNKKLDKGYCESAEEAASNKRTNSLGYPRPMKAVALRSVDEVPYGELFVQYKYNGHRCMIINDSGENIAYSSNGKIIDTIPDILESIDIPEGVILDGELYAHGVSLQRISSWVRRKQPDSIKLTFKCFDAVIDGANFRERLGLIRSFGLEKQCARIEIAPTTLCVGEFNIVPLLQAALRDMYEGLMLRVPDSMYLDGKRHKSAIMKVKRNIDKQFVLDDEFLVVNVKSSKDGWAVLVCETCSGEKFSVTAPGNHEEKTLVLKNKNDFIGKHIRVEFFEYTDSRIPFHPVAIEWREKHNE